MLFIYTSWDCSSHFNSGDLSSRTFLVGFLHSAKDQAATSFPSLLRRILGHLNAQLGLWRGDGAVMRSTEDLGFINNVFFSHISDVSYTFDFCASTRLYDPFMLAFLAK